MALFRPAVRNLFTTSISTGHRNAASQSIWYNKFSGLSPNLKPHENPFWRTWKRDTWSGKRRNLKPVDETLVGLRDLGRPLAFTLLVSGVSFGGAALWQYETLRKVVGEYKKGARSHAKRVFGKAGSFRYQVNMWWNNQSSCRKMVTGIIAVNVSVFLLWRVPVLQPIMLKYFSASPMSGAPCWSLLLSTFSHYSPIHLLANMYVLWSFSEPVCNLLSREQFLATYLTAGVVSGFASYVLKVMRSSPVPSLGASGAIFGILGIVCSAYPTSGLSIAFVGDIIPHSFSASSVVPALIVFDTIGILLRWRFLDHAAHLGGILFGLWYINYGHKYLWDRREPLMKWWHKVRGRP